MILVKIPDYCNAELEYVLSVILGEFLGLEWSSETENRSDFKLCLEGKSNELRLPNSFFSIVNKKWLDSFTVPKETLCDWDATELAVPINLVSDKVPILFGDVKYQVNSKSDQIQLPIDIFGSIFFMLSRYEEVVSAERDIHERFPFTASLAYKSGFLHRPIVDEYVEILWAALYKLWPQLQRKPRKFRQQISCDVDNPYSQYTKGVRTTIKVIGGDLIKRKSLVTAFNTGINAVSSRFGCYRYDPVNTFDWIMDENEKVGNVVTFYFISGHSVPKMDGDYNLDEPRIRDLMRRIHMRGHKIGLHGSYGTFLNPFEYHKDLDTLKMVMEEEGIKQLEIGNRQHYLRWSSSVTAKILEEENVQHDSTLGFAEHAGFRCGTSHEYPMYDLICRVQLKLQQRPLIVMECSVIDSSYMGLGETDRALNFMQTLKDRCRQFDGQFSLLWHNCGFMTKERKNIYKELLA